MEVPVLLVEFEGVIADVAALRREALAEAMTADGPRPSDPMLDAGAGYPVDESVRRVRRAGGLQEDETAVELTRLRAERAFMERAGKGIALTPGARESLERLAAGCRLALVTRAGRREIEFLLDLAGLEGLFRPVITCEDVVPAKPSRAPYLAALARVGQLFPGQQLRPLAVEDSLVGIRGARAAGLPCLAVGDVPAHEALEADGWVRSLADLGPERIRTLAGASAGGSGK
jgi:HAD superfamily hydrolase (TIGR01509 family)